METSVTIFQLVAGTRSDIFLNMLFEANARGRINE